MTDSMVLQIVRDALIMVMLITIPILGAGMIVGLIISILQATTQIQEQSLSFVPKLMTVLLVLMILAPWIINVLVGFTNELFAKIPLMVQ
ncbi:MAG: flagellar biosynthesis protein FliQ [Peptococcaceae bacterium BICA1-7]|nr:MAG: flagellar biosynthesis protein FliQ [Peptococcaceae bacterium BICA1-7]HBV96614.1 flagellar biosynthetic protein FliQ [Desulfotomaculum sp.]